MPYITALFPPYATDEGGVWHQELSETKCEQYLCNIVISIWLDNLKYLETEGFLLVALHSFLYNKVLKKMFSINIASF